MMETGRDDLFMRKNILFTKQVHFYACKIQIKLQLYPSHATELPCYHHYYIVKQSIAPPPCMLSSMSAKKNC